MLCLRKVQLFCRRWALGLRIVYTYLSSRSGLFESFKLSPLDWKCETPICISIRSSFFHPLKNMVHSSNIENVFSIFMPHQSSKKITLCFEGNCFESIQSPFPISSDFDYGGRRRGGVEFSLAFQLNIRFFMAPFPAFNTLMTVLIHISSSSNFSFLHTAHLFYMLQSLGTLIKIFWTNIFAFPDNINIGKK